MPAGDGQVGHAVRAVSGMSDLASLLLSAPPEAPFYAVLDGAQFDDLPTALREGKFVARALYIDRGENNPEQIITAPFMVLLDETARDPERRRPEEVVPALLDLVGGRPAAVFWQCASGEDVLFRHLRSINMVRIPRAEPVQGEDIPDDTHEAVLFRHADATALGRVVPALTGRNAARLLGPAGLLATAETTELLRRDPEVLAPRGMLTLSPEEYGRMNGRKLAESRAKVAEYLRAQCYDCTDMPQEELDQIVLDAERSGAELGLRSEAAHAQWAFLTVVTGGEIANGEPVRHALTTSHNPDFALREMMLLMSRMEAGIVGTEAY